MKDLKIDYKNNKYICTWLQNIEANCNGEEIIIINAPCKYIISNSDIVKYLLKEKLAEINEN